MVNFVEVGSHKIRTSDVSTVTVKAGFFPALYMSVCVLFGLACFVQALAEGQGLKGVGAFLIMAMFSLIAFPWAAYVRVTTRSGKSFNSFRQSIEKATNLKDHVLAKISS